MKRSLPTLHEIIQQQQSNIPLETTIPAANSNNNTQASDNQQPKPVQEQKIYGVRLGQPHSIFYSEFNSSSNYVLKCAWEKALLQYFTAKINNL